MNFEQNAERKNQIVDEKEHLSAQVLQDQEQLSASAMNPDQKSPSMSVDLSLQQTKWRPNSPQSQLLEVLKTLFIIMINHQVL